jgi:putative FmdB family regulatory protein
MPIYEYECEKCKIHFEELQPIKDKPLSKCPKCGGHVHRLISLGAGLIFKGSGFYITDYARKGKTDPSDADSTSSSHKDQNTKTETTKESSTEKSSKPDKDK